MKVSIVFATCNRNDIFKRTLQGLVNMDTSGLDWELVIVDNAGNEETARIAHSLSASLPVKYIVETAPGKNNALNRALDYSGGDLIIFTDDDVIPERKWAKEFVAAADRWPNANLFGGRILPDFPPGAIIPDTNHPFIRSAYAIADWDQPEGEILIDKIWGANMMIRRLVFDHGLRFDPSVGPRGSNYVMGSETDFLKKAAALGHTAIYVPSALIYHQIRAEQLTHTWMRGRAFRTGRSLANSQTEKSSKLLLNIPKWRLRHLIKSYVMYIRSCLTGAELQKLNHAIEIFKTRGYIYQRYIEFKQKMQSSG